MFWRRFLTMPKKSRWFEKFSLDFSRSTWSESFKLVLVFNYQQTFIKIASNLARNMPKNKLEWIKIKSTVFWSGSWRWRRLREGNEQPRLVRRKASARRRRQQRVRPGDKVCCFQLFLKNWISDYANQHSNMIPVGLLCHKKQWYKLVSAKYVTKLDLITN